MYYLRRLTIVAITFGIIVFFTRFLPQALNPVKKSREAREAERRWVSTSPYWLDRQACRWLSLCGLLHVKSDPPAKNHENGNGDHRPELRRLWEEKKQEIPWPTEHPASKHGGSSTDSLRGIPNYVLDYAPLVHLYSKEYFWPADIADHIRHMVPYADGTRINLTEPLNLANLHELHENQGRLFLRSRKDVETRPSWLHSWYNIPASYDEDDEEGHGPETDPDEQLYSDTTTWFDVDRDHPLQRISDPRKIPGGGPNHMIPILRRPRGIQRPRERSAPPPMAQHKPNDSGYSRAPATLILVDKGSGIVDAFWFFFYAYNLGQTVLGVRYGNHVGDWEHAMVRFDSGVPRAVFFSEHEGGQAYAWHAVEKRGNETEKQRPVLYSAVGSHAMYAMPGDHPYILPFGVLKDQTDRGPLWDPRKNFRAYWYDYTAAASKGLEPVREQPEAPTGWFHYGGRWGDRLYGLDDARQWRLFGQYHYVTGPEGPKFKNLAREKMCLSRKCRILHSITEGRKSSWVS